MAVSNRDRVGRTFELLAEGLRPFVDREMAVGAPRGADWIETVTFAQPRRGQKVSVNDPQFLLKVMLDFWNTVFSKVLGNAERNLVHELTQHRNRWAHNESFTWDDAFRMLDSAERLLTAVSAQEAQEIHRAKEDLMRRKVEAEARKATPTSEAINTTPSAGLLPWREVVTPHDDVATGEFQQAEFAADLAQVHRGEGSAEYVEPVEFFRRTYLTAGLRELLTTGARRVLGQGGQPIIDLQTNFGGGKTHSLLALYHLFSGIGLADLPQETQDLMHEAAVTKLPEVRRAVLVGTAISPGTVHTKQDGTQVRTLWGEIAWQLGGPQGYALVADADRTRTSPGDGLVDLFRLTTPCVVLIDEWVAYARQLYSGDDLPAGTFDTHFSFAQALTESAKAVDGVLVVVSIPASDRRTKRDEDTAEDSDPEGRDVEVGGVGGREALRRLRNVIGRMESSWRPASAEESFEIVRRRLFNDLEASRLADRDATARVFGDLYRSHAADFPSDCRRPGYVDRIKAAYPIHPELFMRLYEDWSTLDRFQRTRGVLRLMAAVIHALWAAGDRSTLILPASVPLDDTAVGAELTRYLDEHWKPVIDSDIDGPGSLPVSLDEQFKTLGRYSAARRVARTIFLGSAPTLGSPNRGIDTQRIRLGCVYPGETTATFGDALNRLTDRATFLYVDRDRYWFGVHPSVTRIAQERAERLRALATDELHAEIIKRINAQRRDRGDFRGVHVGPVISSDVPDIPEARLVVLPPRAPHIARAEQSPARGMAADILEWRGTTPRSFRNMLVFLAADQRRLDELEQATANYLAWSSIEGEAAELSLDEHQKSQARSKRKAANEAVKLLIDQTYQWVLVPGRSDPKGPLEWQAVKADTQEPLAVRASRRLVHEGLLATQFPAVLLRLQLDTVIKRRWEDGHVSVAQLWDYFARYTYLPRLADIDVLIGAVSEGPASTTWQTEGFATAVADDEASGRYQGLSVASHPRSVQPTTLVVRPEIALGQLEAEGAAPAVTANAGVALGVGTAHAPTVITQSRPQRFHGAVTLDAERLVRDFGRVAQEVIQHLTSLDGADVDVTVKIAARFPDGFSEQVVRTVSENARTLKFDGFGFEER
ncbi:MAG: Swt1 family HEPN domain-containing protein [Egibacteraceae bacterium]